METILSALVMGAVVILWDIVRMFFQSWWITREIDKKQQQRQPDNCCRKCECNKTIESKKDEAESN
tara:strand:+ start:7014 stop:7211 length:198 start_codon:yes stop_codon:yes gene_type:complete